MLPLKYGVAQIGCGVAQIRVRRSSDSRASACFTAGPGSIPVPAPLVKIYWSGLHRLRLMLENCMSQLKTNKLKRVTDATKP
jgi:hypothetical protein